MAVEDKQSALEEKFEELLPEFGSLKASQEGVACQCKVTEARCAEVGEAPSANRRLVVVGKLRLPFKSETVERAVPSAAFPRRAARANFRGYTFGCAP